MAWRITSTLSIGSTATCYGSLLGTVFAVVKLFSPTLITISTCLSRTKFSSLIISLSSLMPLSDAVTWNPESLYFRFCLFFTSIGNLVYFLLGWVLCKNIFFNLILVLLIPRLRFVYFVINVLFSLIKLFLDFQNHPCLIVINVHQTLPHMNISIIRKN